MHEVSRLHALCWACSPTLKGLTVVFKVAVHVHLHGYTPVVTSRLQASVDIGKEFLSPRVSKSKESQVKFLFLLQPSLDTSMAPGSLTVCSYTSIFSGTKAHWGAVCSPFLPLFFLPKVSCLSIMLALLSVRLCPKLDQHNDWRSLFFFIFFVNGAFGGIRPRTTYSLPYSKTALIAALKQTMEWWTKRQRENEQGGCREDWSPLNCLCCQKKTAHLSHS